MCWTTINDKMPQCMVADEDIPVIKVLKANHVSHEIGKLYEITGSFRFDNISCEPFNDVYSIKHGFHSYLTLNKAKNTWFDLNLNEENSDSFGKVINDYVGRPCIRRIRKHTIVECIIPKGSKYYINNEKEIVSDKIIVSGFPKLNTEE